MASPKRKAGKRKTKGLPFIPAAKRIRDLVDASDLTAAVVAATLLEGALERAIAKRMCRMSAKDHNSIFHSGPLRNFQPKIQIGRALNLFGPETEAEISGIAAIRNEFAHSFANIDFETPRIRSQCLGLKRPEMRAPNIISGSWPKHDNHAFSDEEVKESAKLRYLSSAAILILLLEGSETRRPKRDRAVWPKFLA